MKVLNPLKISSRKKLEKIMNTPNKSMGNIYNLVKEHNKIYNDNLGCWAIITFIPQVQYIETKEIKLDYNTGEIDL